MPNIKCFNVLCMSFPGDRSLRSFVHLLRVLSLLPVSSLHLHCAAQEHWPSGKTHLVYHIKNLRNSFLWEKKKKSIFAHSNLVPNQTKQYCGMWVAHVHPYSHQEAVLLQLDFSFSLSDLLRSRSKQQEDPGSLEDAAKTSVRKWAVQRALVISGAEVMKLLLP